MTVEIANESGVEVDELALVDVSRFTLNRLEIHPLAELSILLMDVDAMTELHVKWMDEPGPTDVMSFPMDELQTARRPDDEGAGPALLGDVVLCPAVALGQAREAGHSLDDELHLLTVHGILHLLGYDHAEPAEERQMFALQDEVLDQWRDQRAAEPTRTTRLESAASGTAAIEGDEPVVNGIDVLLLIVAILLVPIAGLFAAADAAITMVSAARVEELQREGVRGAASLLTIVKDKPRFTNLLLLLRVGAELTATAMVAAVAWSAIGFRWWVGAAVVAVMLLLTYVVIGVGPRTLGRQHPYAVGLKAAGPTRALGRVLSPVASLLILIGNAITPGRGFREGPFSSDIELRELVDLAGSRGVVEETEREMLQSVFDLGDTIAREVMVPRTDVVWIEENKTLRQAMHLATRSGFSRIPVIGEDVDDIRGVVYVKDMIARALSLEASDRGPALTSIMRQPVFVPESKNVDALLREMQRDSIHFAIVVDEYGGTAGILTIEDILEEIVGEITDEYDQEQGAPIEHLADGDVRVSARLPVEDLGDVFDVELPTQDVETVGGLFAQLLGRVPLAGAEAQINGLHLTGEAGVDRRGRPRVQTLLVRRIATDIAETAGPEAVSTVRPIPIEPTSERAESVQPERVGR